MKLIVLNLPRNFSENELAKLFKTYGNIKGCNLVLDAQTGTSKGFGFVNMALAHEAEIAIKELNGSAIQQNKIRVKVAE
jgi:RNA recognition motif-containing protein